jgi:hypothetical protein
MAIHRNSPRKLFTVQQANAALPLVRAIMSDLAALSRDVSERRQRLSFLLDGRDAYGENDPYREELTQVEEELEHDSQRLRGYADELLELGVEPKSAVEGLVDFPSMRDGRLVYLCWKLGEPEVLFWHEWHAGFAGRRPLNAGTGTPRNAGSAIRV